MPSPLLLLLVLGPLLSQSALLRDINQLGGVKCSNYLGGLSFNNHAYYFLPDPSDTRFTVVYRLNETNSGILTRISGKMDYTTNPIVCGGSIYIALDSPSSAALFRSSDGVTFEKIVEVELSVDELLCHNSLLLFRTGVTQYGGTSNLTRSDGTVSGTYVVETESLGADSRATRLRQAPFGVIFVAVGRNVISVQVADGASTKARVLVVLLHQTLAELTGGAALGDGRFLFNLRIYNSNFLYVTDGTTSGTELVREINGYPRHLSDFFEFNGVVYFTTPVESDNEVWRSDGTTNGTYFLFNRGGNASSPLFTALNGKLYFCGRLSGSQIWMVTDGSSASVALTLPTDIQFQVDEVTTMGNEILFKASGSLFAWDPQTNITEVLLTDKPLYQFPSFVTLGQRMFSIDLSPESSPETGLECGIWGTDGTAANTEFLDKVFNTTWQGSSPSTFTPLGSKVLFLAQDGSLPHPWVFDSTNGATFKLKPQNSSQLAEPTGVTACGNQIFFFTDRLWKTDGTEEGTTIVRELPSGSLSRGSAFPYTACLNGILYFSLLANQGAELWRSDGTWGGSHLVKVLAPGMQSTPTGKLAATDSLVYFELDPSFPLFTSKNVTLVYSNGTADGTAAITTHLVRVISQIPLGSWLYFLAIESLLTSDTGLYRMRGPTIELVSRVCSGCAVTSSMSLGATPTHVVFVKRNLEVGAPPQLWATNGTDTFFIKNLCSTTGCYMDPPTGFAFAAGRVFFVQPVSRSYFIYSSDLTATGTVSVVESDGQSFVATSDSLYYTIPTGLFCVKDLKTGAQRQVYSSGFPQASNLARFGDNVMFRGFSNPIGDEPYIEPCRPPCTVAIAKTQASADFLTDGCALQSQSSAPPIDVTNGAAYVVPVVALAALAGALLF